VGIVNWVSKYLGIKVTIPATQNISKEEPSMQKVKQPFLSSLTIVERKPENIDYNYYMVNIEYRQS